MFDTMYNNIGEKIKLLAKIGFIVETIAAVIMGIVYIGGANTLASFILIVAGPCVAWVSSCLLYGFGELIDNSSKLVSNDNTNSPTSNNDLPEL